MDEQSALTIQRVVKEVLRQAYATSELPTFENTPPPDSVADNIFLSATAILFSDASEKSKSEKFGHPAVGVQQRAKQLSLIKP